MAHNTETASTELNFIVILLLLAYVLSSAPRYVRQLKDPEKGVKIENTSPIRQVLKAGMVYTVDQYLKIWKTIRPNIKTWALGLPVASPSTEMKPQRPQLKSSEQQLKSSI